MKYPLVSEVLLIIQLLWNEQFYFVLWCWKCVETWHNSYYHTKNSRWEDSRLADLSVALLYVVSLDDLLVAFLYVVSLDRMLYSAMHSLHRGVNRYLVLHELQIHNSRVLSFLFNVSTLRRTLSVSGLECLTSCWRSQNDGQIANRKQ